MVAFSLLVNAIVAGAPPVPPVVDERWNVTVNGQTIRVDADGSFRLPNIAAADLFGATGPGSAPDFKSDEWFQVVGTATIDGVTWYAYSEPFQIQSSLGGPITYSVLTLPVTQRTPTDIPESIAIEVVSALQDDTFYVDGLAGPGFSPIRVWANFAGVDEPREVTTGGGTTYRTSNRRVVDVAESGGQVVVTATGIGTGFVTATNRGATAVQRFVVTTPCVDTLLVGRVVDSGGLPVQGAIASTEGGSNAPSGTNASGDFSFNVCYTPGTPFSVVVVGPVAGQKAVLRGITPVPDGVTDVGTITLEGNLVFWNVKASGNWNTAGNWHTNSVPTAASQVFVNIEDRLQPPFPEPYTVALDVNGTVTDFTLDSPHAIFRTPGGSQRQLNVTGESRLFSGLFECRDALWKGGTLLNETDFDVYGLCYFGDFSTDGIDAINNGRMNIRFVPGSGPQQLILDGATTFAQASVDDELVINGQLRVQRGASLMMTESAKGIIVQPLGFLKVGDSNPESTFTMNGGTLTVRNCTPLTEGGVRVNNRGTFVLNDGLIDIKGYADDPFGECATPPPPGAGMRGVLEAAGSLATITMNGGVIQNNGLFQVLIGAHFNYNGGTIVGEGADGNGVTFDGWSGHGVYDSLTIGPVATAPAKFTFIHTLNNLAGTIAPGHTIVIKGFGDDPFGDATVVAIPDATNTFTNNGTIRLQTVLDGEFVTLTELFLSGNPNTFVNNGLIEVLPGSFATGEIETKLLENYGTMTLAGDTQLEPSSGVYRNRGTLTVASGGRLTLDAANQSFEQLAGTLSVADEVALQLRDINAGGLPRFSFVGGAIAQGTVVVLNGTVSLSSSATGRGHFMTWGGCTLEGEIGPSHTIVVEGSIRGAGGASLSTPSGLTLTNRGSLVLASPDANMTANLFLSSGQQFINEVGATFDVNSGNGQNPWIAAAFRNKAVTNIRRSLTLGNNNDTHQNQTTGVFNVFNDAVVTFQGNAATPLTNTADAQSSGVVAGLGQLNVGSGRTFQNGGRVEPGGDAMAGTLTVTGRYTQTGGGVLDIELGGTAAGQADKLAISQQATLSGTLNVTLLPGYTPAAGHTFDVVSYGTRSGVFTMINLPLLGGGLVWQTTYMASSLRVTVAGAAATRPPSDHGKRDRRGSNRP